MGVVDIEDDYYVLGFGNDHEIEAAILGDGGIFYGGVRKDTLALETSEGWQDLIGFDRLLGDSWETVFFTRTLRMQKENVALGDGEGILTRGTDGEHQLTTVYDPAIRGYRSVTWEANGKTLLSYDLISSANPPDILYRWSASPVEARTSSPGEPAEHLPHASEGENDMLFLVVSSAPGSGGYGAVRDPTMKEVVSAASNEEGPSRAVARVSDAEGFWHLTSVAGTSDEVTVRLYSVMVSVYADWSQASSAR